MASKQDLLEKLFRKPMPNNFTKKELDSLMQKCGCTKYAGGRGSSVIYYHTETKRTLQFDLPHPGHELRRYHISKTKNFLVEIGEVQI